MLFVDYAATYKAFDILNTNGFARWGLGLAVIWFFTYLNIRGSKVVGDSSNVFGVIVLAPFVLVTVIGLFQWNTEPASSRSPPAGQSVGTSLNLGLFVVMWNYLGLGQPVHGGGRDEEPPAGLPEDAGDHPSPDHGVLPAPDPRRAGGRGHVQQVEWTAGAWNTIAEIRSGGRGSGT